jgi:WD40 repeat protein
MTKRNLLLPAAIAGMALLLLGAWLVSSRTGSRSDRVMAAMFSTDGQRLYCGCLDRALRVVETATGRDAVWDNGKPSALDVALSPNETKLVTGHMRNELMVWDTRKHAPLHIIMEHKGWVTAVAFISDATFVSGSTDGTIRVWDSATGRCIRKPLEQQRWVSCVTVSREMQLAASGDEIGNVIIWDKELKVKKREWEGHRDSVRAMVFVPSAKKLVTVSDDTTIKIWDTDRQTDPVVISAHKKPVIAVAAHKDGEIIATASADDTTRIWQLKKGKELAKLDVEELVTALAFSPAGDVLVAGAERHQLYFYRTKDWKREKTMDFKN